MRLFMQKRLIGIASELFECGRTPNLVEPASVYTFRMLFEEKHGRSLRSLA
jgi:hypothetical protein